MLDAAAKLCVREKVASLAVVGHLPSAANAIAAALGAASECINLHKGSVALLEFSGRIAAGRASLEFLLRPRALI
jgi:phosphohistidine phosphatase SixA